MAKTYSQKQVDKLLRDQERDLNKDWIDLIEQNLEGPDNDLADVIEEIKSNGYHLVVKD
jgi:hypothetical protein